VTPTHTRPQRALLALAALAMSGLIAACGSTSGGSSSQTTSTTSAAASAGSGSSAGRTALTACLRKHGITLPARAGAGAPGGGAPPSGATAGGSGAPAGGSPPTGFPGGGAGSAKLQAAFKACGANFPARPGGAALSHQTIQKYVTCVRQHDYQLPNPNFSGKGPIFPASIRSNTKFQAASRACQNLLAPAQAPASTGA